MRDHRDQRPRQQPASAGVASTVVTAARGGNADSHPDLRFMQTSRTTVRISNAERRLDVRIVALRREQAWTGRGTQHRRLAVTQTGVKGQRYRAVPRSMTGRWVAADGTSHVSADRVALMCAKGGVVKRLSPASERSLPTAGRQWRRQGISRVRRPRGSS